MIGRPTHSTPYSPQQIEPAFPEILGYRSAASLATGPVIPEPFISPLLLIMTAALSKHERITTEKTRAYSILTFEVDKVTFSPAVCLPLTDDDGLQYFLSELRLSLLDRCEEHISD